MSRVRAAVLVLMLGPTVGCQKLTQVKVQPATAMLEKSGQSEKLKASQLDADGKPMKKDAAVVWSSEPAGVVAVAPDGTATAKKSGKATVTAKVGDVQGKASVEVHIPGKITGADLTLDAPGQAKTSAFTVVDDAGQKLDAATAKLALESADPKVASAASPEPGMWAVTGVGPGQTQLRATYEGLTQTFQVTVKAPELTSLTVLPAAPKVKPGGTLKLVAMPMVGEQSMPGVPVQFTSLTPKVATVDADGTLHGIAKGKATITATAGGKSVAVPVTVAK
jgi:hypothetical protein